MFGRRVNGLLRDFLPTITNYKWIQYLLLFWSLRMALLALSIIFPVLTVLTTSQDIDISTFQIKEYQLNEISNINELIFQRVPFIINNFTSSHDQHDESSPSIRDILDLELPRVLTNIKLSQSKEFIHFSNDQAWSNKLLSSRVYSLVNMKTEDFFTHRSNSSDENYVYLSRQIHSPSSSIIVQTLSPNLHLLPSLTGIVPEVRLWMSSKDVLATPHYDMEHNFFIQLNGTKQFILSSPIHYEVFQPHSYLHPHWRQSQHLNLITTSAIRSSPHFSETQRKKKTSVINIAKNQSHSFEECLLTHEDRPCRNESSVHEIVLKPSQLLYIPPFYYHSVRALDSDSISLNSWIGSDYVQIAEKLRLHVPLPFLDRSEIGTKLSSLGQFIKAVLIRLSIPISLSDFKRNMLSRVELNAFDEIQPHEREENEEKVCENEDNSSCSTSCENLFPFSLCTEQTLKVAEFSNKVRQSTEKLSSHLGKFSSSIQKVLLLDYFDEIIDTLVAPNSSTPQGIKCFLQRCVL